MAMTLLITISSIEHWLLDTNVYFYDGLTDQSGRSPKVVALFSATDFSSYIVELLQLHGTI